MAWLDVMRSRDPGGSGYDNFTYTDPATGRLYVPVYQVTSASGAEGDTVRTLTGYVGTDYGPWFKGKRATVYSTSGAELSTFEISDPNKKDIGGMIVLMAIGAMTAYAAWAAFGPAAMGTAEGTTSAATAESLANGPILSKAALDGTTAFGANSVAGAYDLSTVAQVAAATVQTAPALTATITAATTATGSSLAGTVASGAGLVSKVLGAASAVLGLTSAHAGQQQHPPGVYTTADAPPSGLLGMDAGTALFLAGALGLVAFVATRKG